jgi:FAD dependent oxidoreductase TIGR03364
MTKRADLAIVGAGIMGLAHAYAAAVRGLKVVVFERSGQASGASVRNFGMIWPVAQPHGRLHQLALRSRAHWLDILAQAKLPYRPDGSLLLAYAEDEAEVAKEFVDLSPDLGYDCTWLDRAEVLARSRARAHGLIGGLWSATELTVDPRVTLPALPRFLAERFGVETRFGRAVSRIDLPTVEAGDESWAVDAAIVCSGDDFESLYPATFAASGLTRVKLQMLRTVPQPAGWHLGPALAAGLTLRFYPTFAVCRTLPTLRDRIAEETPAYDRWGIHGLVSETASCELTLGDSHEYGPCVDVFNREDVDDLILGYIQGFLDAPDLTIAQRWHGVYAKHPEQPYLVMSPAPRVRIVSSPGGTGMTLSFGIAEETIASLDL